MSKHVDAKTRAVLTSAVQKLGPIAAQNALCAFTGTGGHTFRSCGLALAYGAPGELSRAVEELDKLKIPYQDPYELTARAVGLTLAEVTAFVGAFDGLSWHGGDAGRALLRSLLEAEAAKIQTPRAVPERSEGQSRAGVSRSVAPGEPTRDNVYCCVRECELEDRALFTTTNPHGICSECQGPVRLFIPARVPDSGGGAATDAELDAHRFQLLEEYCDGVRFEPGSPDGRVVVEWFVGDGSGEIMNATRGKTLRAAVDAFGAMLNGKTLGSGLPNSSGGQNAR